MRILVLEIDGMKCDGCADTVRASLADLQGVSKVEVDLDEGIARLQLSGETDPARVRSGSAEAVAEAGYTVRDTHRS